MTSIKLPFKTEAIASFKESDRHQRANHLVGTIMTEKTQIIKTISSAYYLHLEGDEFSPGYWINLATVKEIFGYLDGSKNETIAVHFIDGTTRCLGGTQARELLEELKRISA